MSSKIGGQDIQVRPLHFIWICDCSGSMAKHGKIDALKQAIRAAIPDMRATAGKFPRAEVLVRAIGFSDGARWHVARPTPVADYTWQDLSAGRVRDTGESTHHGSRGTQVPALAGHHYVPVLALISDGQPTDDFASGLKALMSESPVYRRPVLLSQSVAMLISILSRSSCAIPN